VSINAAQAASLLDTFQSLAHTATSVAAAKRNNFSATGTSTPRGSAAAAVAAAHRERDLSAAVTASITPMAFIRAVMQVSLDEMADARRVRVQQEQERLQQRNPQAVASPSGSSTQHTSSGEDEWAAFESAFFASSSSAATVAPPLNVDDGALLSVPCPFRTNPLRRGQRSPYEHVETVEYG
jgi:hypothetical protein